MLNISAIIPTYNNAAFIKDAVLSIQHQTVPVTEIIIVDDGSTDNTQQIIQQLDGNIHYIRQQNRGPSAARNTGIKAAKGEWIAFLDADDQWTTGKLEKQIQALQHSPELKLIAGDMSEIDIDNQVLEASVLNKHHFLDKFKALDGKPIPDAFIGLLRKNFIPTGTVLIKKDILLETGLFNDNIRYGEDLELWAKVASQHPITCLPDILMLRRQHSSNSTQSAEPMLTDLIKVMESVKSYTSKQHIQSYNPDQYITEALNNLGYWYFNNYQLSKAQYIFRRSLKTLPTKRALLYLLICLLPNRLVTKLRTIKQLL